MKKLIILFLVSVSVNLFALEEAEYLRLLYNASKAVPLSHSDIDKGKAKSYMSFSDLEIFNKLAPAEALPLLISSLEKGIITNRIETVENTQTTNSVIEFANYKVYYLMGLSFGFDSVGTVAFPWLTGKGDDLTIPVTQYHYFWWYEGRKYMPNIWNNWYSCWQTESGRETPRKIVLNQLANEITALGYHIFPYLASAMETDQTLTNVLVHLRQPHRGGWIFKDFPKWYKGNKTKFALPECETLKTVLNRISLDKMPISESNKNDMLRWQGNEESFYLTNNFLEYYWYYKINAKKDVTEEDVFQAKYGD